MAEKRYYWLKLKDDFFDSIRIKKLRSLAGGDTYTIIYLKMLLKAIKNDGILEYQGIETSICEEIALDINESPDNVGVALKYLLSCGLAEQQYNDCLLPEAIELVGSEQESAERVRNYRERQKQQALHCNGDVTEVKRLCNTEIDIEKREKIQEIDTREKSKRFTPPTYEELLAYANEIGSTVNIDDFIDYYDSNGWMVGKSKMKDWKATLRRWSRNRKQEKSEADIDYLKKAMRGEA